MSEPSTSSKANTQRETHQEFLDLANLAGISAPERLMKILFEMLAIGVSPAHCHTILRTLVANRRGATPKCSSRHAKHLAIPSKSV